MKRQGQDAGAYSARSTSPTLNTPLASDLSSPMIPSAMDYPEDWSLVTEDQVRDQSDVTNASSQGGGSSSSGATTRLGMGTWDHQGGKQLSYVGSDLVPAGGNPLTPQASSCSNTSPLDLQSLFGPSASRPGSAMDTDRPRLIEDGSGSGNGNDDKQKERQQQQQQQQNTDMATYSVTCSRKNLKKLACSILDTVLSEQTFEDDGLVTMNIQLDK
jgi:hypothetical protein